MVNPEPHCAIRSYLRDMIERKRRLAFGVVVAPVVQLVGLADDDLFPQSLLRCLSHLGLVIQPAGFPRVASLWSIALQYISETQVGRLQRIPRSRASTI